MKRPAIIKIEQIPGTNVARCELNGNLTTIVPMLTQFMLQESDFFYMALAACMIATEANGEDFIATASRLLSRPDFKENMRNVVESIDTKFSKTKTDTTMKKTVQQILASEEAQLHEAAKFVNQISPRPKVIVKKVEEKKDAFIPEGVTTVEIEFEDFHYFFALCVHYGQYIQRDRVKAGGAESKDA